MEYILGTSIIILLFAFLSLVAYLIFNSSFFSGDKKGKSRNFRSLDKLKKQNKRLNEEIKFLEDKNKKFKIKIEQMKEIINSLEEQKKQLKQSENRLKSLRLQKDETLSMVAHDIKNPAATIKSFVELLESYDLSAQEQHEVFSGLLESSLRLIQLADDFSKIISEDFQEMNLTKKKCNFNDTVESIIKINHVVAKGKKIDLRFYKPSDDIEVEMDEPKIKEVVDNFVNNAIKFCPEESRVNVTISKENKFVMLEITDNGFGLTADEINKAFTKGGILSNKPTGNESSSGLGLWIAKKIIEKHNGKVWVKSQKGFGASFYFNLPITN